MLAAGMRSYRSSTMATSFNLGNNETADELLAPVDTLGQLLFANAQRAPGAACVVSAEGDVLTWQQLLGQLERTHTALRAFGFDANDRIALVLANGPTLAVAFLTVAACAACAPLNPVYSVDEFTFYLSDLKAQALITSDAAGSAIDAAARLGIRLLVLEPDGSAPGLFDLKGDPPVNKSAAAIVTSDSVALFLHTSGTTSRPKLVPLRHSNLIASANNMVDTLQLSAADRCLNLMPLFHVHGLVGGLLAPLAAAGSAVCPANFRPGDFFQCLEATRPTWYTAVPAMHRAIVAEVIGQDDVATGRSLRFVRSSSSPLPPSLFSELVRIFQVPVVEAYSMTEAAHQMTCNPVTPGKQKPGTVGLSAGPEVALLDESGRLVCAAGATGEVVVRGPTVMSGYEANPEANAEAFVNGWFRTGDQGRLDSDGYLELTGRLKEQINRGGEKISPLEIDQMLLRHPDVSEAVAFGFPHPSLGEEIAAAVVPRAGTNIVPAKLQAFLHERLAPFKIPCRILILDRMPKGPTGKIQRRQLSKLLGLDAAESRHKSREHPEQLSALELELLELWRKMLNCNSIGLDDDFFESGGDSLLAMQMLLEVGKMIGHSVPETILFERSTIRELVRGIAEFDLKVTPEIQILTKGNGPPFIFFHGNFTGPAFYTRHLARLLGPDQTFISVPPHGGGQEPLPDSFERMAFERLPAVLAAHPRGPFRLGGYCNGAMVALETARLLIGAGRRVELLVMVDTPTLNLRPTMRMLHQVAAKMLYTNYDNWEKVHPRLASAMDVVWRRLSIIERMSLTSLTRLLATFRHKMLGDLPAPVDQLELKYNKFYTRLYRHYFPTKIEVPIIYYSAGYSTSPLSNLSPTFETVFLPGGHAGCVTSHVKVLADDLRRRLERLNATGLKSSQDTHTAAYHSVIPGLP
jgi:oxalate---CoA ligase